MDFLKHKTGIIMAILCLVAVVFIVWFFLFADGTQTMPEGTLVEQQQLTTGNEAHL